MTENEEKQDMPESEENKASEEEVKDNVYDDSEKKVEETDEKYVWVDKNGKRPLSYLMPMYIGVGAALLIIWILIIVFAIMPAWDEYEEDKKGGIDIHKVDPNTETKENKHEKMNLELSGEKPEESSEADK